MISADAVAPVLAALSINALSKIVVGWVGGGRAFALRLIPGLILVIAARGPAHLDLPIAEAGFHQTTACLLLRDRAVCPMHECKHLFPSKLPILVAVHCLEDPFVRDLKLR